MASSADLLRELAEAYNSGDTERFLAGFDPGVVFTPDPEWPEPGPFQGREAFAQFLEEWQEAWGEVRLEIDRVDERGDAAILRCRWTVVGASSGAPVPTAFTAVVHFTATGLVSEVSAFFDHDQAMRSVGPEVW